MMYSEFVAGTGCKENDHNYKVFQNLEIMYMNSDMSKAEIYEYGKKLVDNSKSEEELRIEAEIKSEIEHQKDLLDYHKREIGYYKTMIESWRAEGDKEMVRMNQSSLNYHKQEAKAIRGRIASLKHFFNL